MLKVLFFVMLSVASSIFAPVLQAEDVTAKSTTSNASGDSTSSLGPYVKQFADVLAVVQHEGAEAAPTDKLIYSGAIPGMLRVLDPHTQIFDPDQFAQFQEMSSSNQKGFGTLLNVMRGHASILQILPDTPASRAGLMAGDQVLTINHTSIANMEPEQIGLLFKAAREKPVDLTIRRRDSAHFLNLTLSPELVKVPSIDRAVLLSRDRGYLRIRSWNEETARELNGAILELGGDKLESLLIDLRDNPGGLVTAALESASLLLAPGQRIVTVKGRQGEVDSATVPEGGERYRFKLAVLINEKTASASEIFTGALQDHDRALIIGTTSYGKGLVQTIMPLSNQGGLSLTTAFYYTPSGRSIQRPIPDSALSSSFTGKETSVVFRTDGGRPVQGGGGIQPDIFVAPQWSQIKQDVTASGATIAYATEYVLAHPSLPQGFSVTARELDGFRRYLEARHVVISSAGWAKDQEWLRSQLEVEILTLTRGLRVGEEIGVRRDFQVQMASRALDQNLLAQSVHRPMP
jgi:carboxyl-terminal processing protease